MDTVEAGFTTKDLAALVGPDQKWMNTQDFVGKLNGNSQASMEKVAA